jgi:hypothetical protein
MICAGLISPCQLGELHKVVICGGDFFQEICGREPPIDFYEVRWW